MRIILSLPILVAVLSMVLEGPAPAQAAIETPSILDKLKEFGSTLEEKVRAAADSIKQSEIPKKTRTWFLDTYSKVKEKLKATFS